MTSVGQQEWQASIGDCVGDYELLGKLGEGGMAVVFFAKHQQQRDLVALKLAKPEVLEVACGADMFLNEVRNASSLRHANIVPIYTSGKTVSGTPYFVMPLFEQGTLAEPLNREAFAAPARALELMIAIVRAVQFAHERLVLHCDLKPDNILIDAADAPHVSDFGLARVIGSAGAAAAAGIVGGASDWMSPEQRAQVWSERSAREAPAMLTASSDVFSLGVMLRWLVDPHPRSRRARRTAWELGAIAGKAAEPEPERRYQSAAQMASELERARDGYPIEAERNMPLRRAAKWMRRHRLLTAAGVQLLLLLLYFALVPLAVLHEVRDTIRQRNEFAARAQAGAVMNELRTFTEQIEALAARREVRALVNHPDVYVAPPALPERLGGFDSIAVFQLDGTVRARTRPPTNAYASRNFSFRDYWRTLEQLQGRAPRTPPRGYVSRVFRAKPDGRLFIGFTAPLFDEDDKPIGVVLGSTLARSTFGAVQMNCTGEGDCMTALLGSRDRDGPDEPMPYKVNVLAEPGLADGEDRTLDIPTSTRICAALACVPRARDQLALPVSRPALIVEAYRDPVTNRSSIAATAPVGGTGLVVLVATPDSAADALASRMVDRMKALLWIPLAPGLLLLGVLALTLRWRRRIG